MSESMFPLDIKLHIENEKLLQHFHICNLLSNLYKAKNHDYGDSFHKTYEEFGKIAIAIRLQDKISRLSALSTKDQQLVTDESIRDTLMDIANYAILGIMEMDDEDRKPIVTPNDNKEMFTYPDITEDTPMEEFMRIHKDFWNYVVEHGDRPPSRFFNGVSPICQFFECAYCPIVWPENDNGERLCTIRNGLAHRWDVATGDKKTELARQIRDLPWKFEQKKRFVTNTPS